MRRMRGGMLDGEYDRSDIVANSLRCFVLCNILS
jgi:hypothetical protein